MRPPTLLHAAGSWTVLHFVVAFASAQNCYYPNGDIAQTDASCSKDGGACCPLGWDCLSNGLCFLGNEHYYGRYTCTDRSWGDSCPEYCTANHTAAGNEAIARCSDGSWCCDQNRDPRKPDCCSWDEREVIVVPRGTTVTSITSTPRAPSSVPPFTPAAVRPTTTTTTSSTTGDATLTSSSPPSITSHTAASTITTRATSSDSTGGISIITSIITTLADPAPTATEGSNGSAAYGGGHGAADNGVVIGVSVGVSVGVLAFFVALWFFWRRRQKKWAAHRSPPTSDYPNNHMSFMYSHGKQAHEIDSVPIADVGGGDGGGGGRDKSRPISELTGSNHFMPGSPGSSAHNSVGPPVYSPPVNGSGIASVVAPGAGGWSGSLPLPGVHEQAEPLELPAEGKPSREISPVSMAAGPRWKGGREMGPLKMSEMGERTQVGGGGGGAGTTHGGFIYEPYRPHRPEAQHAATADEKSLIPADGGAVGDEEALRTMSPDPPQSIQGGLRVVNL